MGYGYYGYYKPRKTVGEIQAMAKANIKKTYSPVIIEGKKISVTWWGNAWCANIDRYADEANRLSRGRSYAKNNTVIDLKITGGEIKAKVQGSRKKPYDVTVRILPIKKENYEAILSVCSGSLESLSDLEQGNFPQAYKQLFTADGKGLFPTLREMSFSCSCPDGAYMCKHVAAVLYAIGHRLDDDPLIFLTMRGIDVASFSDKVIRKEITRIWSKSDADLAKERVISMEDAHRLFGAEEYSEDGESEADILQKLSKGLL